MQETSGDQAPMESSILLMEIRRVLRAWERLRLVYNALLTVLVVIFVFAFSPELLKPELMPKLLLNIIGANLLFFAGPVVESWCVLIGWKLKGLRNALMTLGTLLALGLATAELLSTLLPGSD